ncbi:MAG: Asp-tRNA(Asn)/Glu-tRNA(Gln) amidotransferase subunit GatA [Burkholderiaceae bacterium]
MSRSWHELDLAALRRALDQGEVSATQLAGHFLERIASSRLNAFTGVHPEATLAQARQADGRLAAGERTPLLGIPVAHKDIFVTRDWASTAGSKMLEGYMSPFDATVVARLQAAGAVCLGKTNCDEFAMGSSNEHSHFGPVRNPWDESAVPGGSSGGAAAAVAAGLTPLATGTDTGGSVRQPAAFCGITGIKPTYGRVSRYGMIAFASSLDQGGAMAASALECAALLNAMAGFDPRDATSLALDAEDFVQGLQGSPLPQDRPAPDAGSSKPLAGLRVGVPEEWFGEGLAPDVARAVKAALAVFESLGAELIGVTLPRTRLAIPAYYVIAPAEASSNLSRFDGVRYGHRASDARDLGELYRKTRSEGFGPEVRRRILIGTYVLSHGYYDAYYLQAQKLRRLIAQDFDAAFERVDLIAGPVAPTVAWNLGEIVDDPVRNYLADLYTLGASLAGLPGMSVPAGFGEGSRPVGLQLIAPRMAESRLLAAADRFQRATDWHRHRPAGV